MYFLAVQWEIFLTFMLIIYEALTTVSTNITFCDAGRRFAVSEENVPVEEKCLNGASFSQSTYCVNLACSVKLHPVALHNCTDVSE
jgi:hypothetical protein